MSSLDLTAFGFAAPPGPLPPVRHLLDLTTEEMRARAFASLEWRPDRLNSRGVWYWTWGAPDELRDLVREHGKRNMRSGYRLGAYRCAGWRYYAPDSIQGEAHKTLRRISEVNWLLNHERDRDSYQRGCPR